MIWEEEPRKVVEVDGRRRLSLARVFPDLRPGARFRVEVQPSGVLVLTPVDDVPVPFRHCGERFYSSARSRLVPCMLLEGHAGGHSGELVGTNSYKVSPGFLDQLRADVGLPSLSVDEGVDDGG